MAERGEPVEVVDIRPQAEREAWHIPGSQNVDAYEAILANRPGPLTDYKAPKDRPVVAVCFVGETSGYQEIGHGDVITIGAA